MDRYHKLAASTFASLLLAVTVSCGGGGSSGVTEPPPEPPPLWPPLSPLLPLWIPLPCESVDGPPVVTFSADAGATWQVPTESILGLPGPATYSIAASHQHGGRMVASHGNDLYHSLDGGCTWGLAYEGTEPMRVVAPGFPWFLYAVGERGDTVITVTPGSIRLDDLPFHAIDVTHTQLSTTYALTGAGGIMRMVFDLDAVLWEPVGPAPSVGMPKHLAVKTTSTPYDPTHMVVSMEEGPPFVSFNDGASWTEAQGLMGSASSITTGRPYFGQNLYQEWLINRTEVWIYVVRTIIDSGTGDEEEEHVIARSTDGGRNFVDVVIADGADVELSFPDMSPTPGQVGSIAFTGDYCASGQSRVYRYDAINDVLSVLEAETVAPFGVESILYHPQDIDHIYIGPRVTDSCGP